MLHGIHRVTGFERIAPFVLSVQFEDGTSRTIDFSPVLHGGIYGPLRDSRLFEQVRLDEVVRYLTWPNGADFESGTLYDWPTWAPQLAALARTWTEAPLTTKR
jgi:Protein of unknown function (DUF2442)